MDEDLRQYRNHLVTAEQKSQEDFDKTLITLSGGALGISFAFVKDVIGNSPMLSAYLLIWAWMSWTLSLACTLFSYYSSHWALRHAIKQVDAGTIYTQRPGGWSGKVTVVLNIVGGILFIVGVGLIIFFVFRNVR